MKLSIHTYYFYVACLLEHILLVEKLNYTIYLTNLEGALRFTISIIIKHGSTLNLIKMPNCCTDILYRNTHDFCPVWNINTIITTRALYQQDVVECIFFFTYRYVQNTLQYTYLSLSWWLKLCFVNNPKEGTFC